MEKRLTFHENERPSGRQSVNVPWCWAWSYRHAPSELTLTDLRFGYSVEPEWMTQSNNARRSLDDASTDLSV